MGTLAFYMIPFNGKMDIVGLPSKQILAVDWLCRYKYPGSGAACKVHKSWQWSGLPCKQFLTVVGLARKQILAVEWLAM